MLIGDIGNLVNFLGARTIGEASTEFGDDERDSKTLGILCSGADSLLVPLFALLGVSNLRFSSHTLIGAELTAVGMVVKDMDIRSNFTTGRSFKTNIEDESGCDTDLIREGNGLEPHLLFDIMRLVLAEDVLVHRGQVLLVHMSGNEEHRVLGRVGWEWLVKRIVTNDIGVVSETG